MTAPKKSPVVAGPKGGYRELSTTEQTEYIEQLTAAVSSARLSGSFADKRRLESHFEALSPLRHQGLYPTLNVDGRTGLPAYREWTRVNTDRSLAEKILDGLGDLSKVEEQAQSGVDIRVKQFKKAQYFKWLSQTEICASSSMKVALRRVEPKTKTASFSVVFDKLETSGALVRYVIDLSQRDSFWDRPMVTLDAESAAHTEDFRSLIYRFTSLDAEFTFGQLSSMPHLEVERVTKGTVGPFYFEWTQNPWPKKQLRLSKNEMVATFAFDMAATDLKHDQDNDPFDRLHVDRLSPQAQNEYRRARKKYRFKVFKDRKFVVTPTIVPAVAKTCENLQTKNVIYPLRLRK